MNAPMYDHHFFRPDETCRPVFIVGDARSGTTMLRLMLNRSPSIAVLSETWFATRVWERRWAFPPSTADGHFFFGRMVDSFIRLLNKIPDEFPLDLDRYRDNLSRGPRHLNRLLAELGSLLAKEEGKDRWGEKTPIHVEYIPLLSSMFPKACFVHIVRDPRDVISSQLRMPFISCSDPVAIALRWRRIVQGVEEQKERLGDRLISIRYEDLVALPGFHLAEACAQIDLKFDESMVRFHESARRYAPKQEHMAKLFSPVDNSAVSRWRCDLDAPTVAVIESVLQRQMHLFGYVASSEKGEGVDAAPLVSRILAAEQMRAEWEGAPYVDYIQMQRSEYRGLVETIVTR